MKLINHLSKRIISLLLAFIILISPLLANIQTVNADTGTHYLSMSVEKYHLSIPSLGYNYSRDNLWNIVASGNYVFCISPHRIANNHDAYTYQSYNAVTFWNQAYAKCLTYFNTKLSWTTLNKAQTQAYMWATAMGRSKEQAVYEAGRNVSGSYSWNDAVNFCKAVNNTHPEGEIRWYTCTKCPKGLSLSRHQTLLGWSPRTVAPKYAYTEYENSKTGHKPIQININKKDVDTKTPLAEAKFEVYWNDEKITTLTTNYQGKASLTSGTDYRTSTWWAKRGYVTNWSELSVNQQKQLTANGWYDSRAKAQKAAEAFVNQKVNEELQSLKNKNNLWKVKEIKAPEGYYITEQEKVLTETKDTTSLTFDFTNTAQKGSIIVKKWNESVGNTDIKSPEATMVGAEYTVTAGADIIQGDKVIYNKGQVIGKIVIDDSLTGKIDGLPLGTYWVEETKAPKGFELENELHVVNLTPEGNKKVVERTVDSCDREYQGWLEIYKTFDGKNVESGAEFEIRNSKNEVVETLITDSNGYTKSQPLPYGTYKVTQTKTKNGYMKVNDFIFTIDENTNKTTITKRLDDEKIRDYSYLKIVKSYKQEDADAGVNIEKLEKDAEFQILNSEGVPVQTLVTNSDGFAESKALEAGTYTVKQTKGKEHYAFVDDFTFTVKEGEIKAHEYKLVNPFNGGKIKVEKTMSKDGVLTPEEKAEFYAFDINAMKKLDTSSTSFGSYPYNVSTKSQVVDFVQFIEENNLTLGTFTTNSKGVGAILINKDGFDINNGFAIIQSAGAEHYKMSGIVESSQANHVTQDGMQVYKFSLDNPYDEYGYIEIYKEESITNTKTKPELNAEFEIVDLKTGEVINTLTTNKDGYAKSQSLNYGKYMIHQTVSSLGKNRQEDQVFTLNAENKHKTIRFEMLNKETPILLNLIKTDGKTKTPLAGAEYVLKDSEGQIITTLITGKDENLGKATCYLPYGTYTLIETKAPEGYVRNEKEVTFTISDSTVQYNDKNEPIYTINQTNEPIYGYLTINKKGNLLTGYSESGENKGFQYELGGVKGAEYGLYAEEDIVSNDGKTVYYKAGTLISKKTTNDEGKIQFTQIMDGKETTKLYLGKYYVQEISAPDGFTIDKEKHSVILTYDKKPGDLNDIDSGSKIPDEDKPAEGDVNTGKDIVTYKIGSNTADSVLAKFYPDTETLRVSGTGNTKTFANQSEVPWFKDGMYLKFKKVIFESDVKPTNLDYWFKDCSSLEDVSINLTGSSITSMVSTFENCTSLKQIPNLENCKSLSNLTSTFKNCTYITQAPNLKGCTGVTNLNNTFENCVSMKNTPNLSGMTKISSMVNTFKNCKNMSGDLVVDISSTSLATSKFSGCLSGVSQGTAEIELKGKAKWQVLDPMYESKSSNSNVIYESTRSTLLPGPQFNEKLRNLIGVSQDSITYMDRYKINNIYTTDIQAPSNVSKVDVSVDNSGSAMMWKANNNIYISSQKTGCKLKANQNSKAMFAGGEGEWELTKILTNSIDVSNLDTSNVTDMSAMFAGVLAGLNSSYEPMATNIIGLEKFNTSKVTNMYSMFSDGAFSSLNLSNFDTSKVTNMAWMFANSTANGFTGQIKINFGKFDTRNVEIGFGMFIYSKVQGTLTIRGTKMNKTVTGPSGPFNGLSGEEHTRTGLGYEVFAQAANENLTTTPLILNYDSTNRAIVQKIVAEASSEYLVAGVKLGTLQSDLPPVTTPTKPTLPEIVGTYNIGKTTASSVVATLHRNGELVIDGTGDVKTFASATSVPWNAYKQNITKVTFGNKVLPSNLDYYFDGCNALKEVVLNGDNLANLTSLKNTFKDCYNLKAAPNLDKAVNLSNLENTFYNCYDLKNPSLPEMTRVTNLNGTFYNCYNIITVPNLEKATQVTTMNSTFAGCKNLDGTMLINANPTSYTSCFANTALGKTNVYLNGTSSKLKALEQTKTTGSHVYTYGVKEILVTPLYTKFEVNQALSLDKFQFIGLYTDRSAGELKLTSNDVSMSISNVPSKSGNFDVTFNFTGQYSSIPSKTVTLTAIDLNEYDFDTTVVTEVVKELNLTDDAQTVGLRINKTDDKGEILQGAVFQLKTLVDIYDKNGNLIVRANTVLEEKESDEFGAVDFGTLFPTEVYTKGDATNMYQIVEISAPSGYQKSNEVLNFSGKIPDKETTIIQHEKTVVNSELQEITVKKEWDDSNNFDNLRPSSIQVEVLKNNSVVKTVTLSASNNWQATISGLQKNENGQKIEYTFREKTVPSGYTSSYTFVDGICTFVNTHKVSNINLSVEKVWDDQSDKDGIRPAHIMVDLFANGTLKKELTLSGGNSWKQTVSNLPKLDVDGNEIHYEFIERETGYINGNANTGYSVNYQQEGNKTIITNKHIPQVIELTVEKVWDDNGNEDNLRPSQITVELLGNGKLVQTMTLSDVDGWASKTIKNLPKYEDGREIYYEFKEVTTDIIGTNAVDGYEASYSVSGNKTTITNKHIPSQPLGKITLTKKIKASDILWDNGDPTFIFKVVGTLTDGSKITYQGLVTFTKEYVEQHTDSNGYVSISYEFLGLEYGTYISEEEIVARYKLNSITDIVNGSLVNKEHVSMNIDKKHLNGAATFINDKYEWGKWSDTANVINEIRKPTLEQISSTLITGPEFNKILRNDFAGSKSIEFVKDRLVPEGANVIDLSQKQDNSIKGWKEGETLYVSSDKLILANEDSSKMFCGEYRNANLATRINLDNFDTRNVKNMSYMFSYCVLLPSLDVSRFDTSNVTDMSYMFNVCEKLTNLNVSSFNTSNVTDMTYMFYWCEKLTNLDLSNFNTSQVTNMNSIFRECVSLTDLDISGFDTSNVTDMTYMFEYCRALTTLKVSSNNWRINPNTDVQNMWSNCKIQAPTHFI